MAQGFSIGDGGSGGSGARGQQQDQKPEQQSLLDRQLLQQLAKAADHQSAVASIYRDNSLSVSKDPARDGYIINDGRTRVFVDRITGQHSVETSLGGGYSPVPAAVKARAMANDNGPGGNMAWLDHRVNEMRVRL